jgi:hypothetical protein
MFFLLFISMTCFVACGDPVYLDNGFVVRDGISLNACKFPIKVMGYDSFDEDVLFRATNSWNSWVGVPVFDFSTDFPADILVSVGFVPVESWDPEYPDRGEAGIAYLEYTALGCITHCEIVISSDIEYDDRYFSKVLEHELGHCLGLSDDPGPPITVDLRSVMSRPIDPLGVLTEHDRALVLELMD